MHLADPECFKGNRMQQVKTLVDTLQEKVTAQIGAEITKAKEAAQSLKDRLCGMAEFSALSTGATGTDLPAFQRIFSVD